MVIPRIDELLAVRAEQVGAQPFIRTAHTTITFAQCQRAVSALATALAPHRVAGRFVGVCAPNCPAFVVSYFAVLRAGGMVVPLNPKLGAEELAYIARDANLAGVLHVPSSTPVPDCAPAILLDDAAVGTVLLSGTPTSWCGKEPVFPQSLRDVAVCIYTSGTTGHPKGALLTHASLLHNARICAAGLQSTNGTECFVTVLPLFHAFAASACMLQALWVSSSMLLIEQFQPADVLRLMQQHGATVFLGVPAMYAVLAQVDEVPTIPSWRLNIAGGAPLPQAVFSAFRARFGMPIHEGDGPTECGPATSINPVGGVIKVGTIGVPLQDVTMDIVDDDMQALPDNTVGEIAVKSPSNFIGYLNQPEATAQTLVNGWVRTGDLGMRDSDGYFSIVDRVKDMFIVGGLNVYSREVEEYVARHPSVREVAVVGAPDRLRGEVPIAFVVVHPERVLTTAELRVFLRGKLAAYKIPRHVHCVASLPRNATGKILKTTLRAQARALSNAPADALRSDARQRA
jgi:long-chain acyl-CoA synthetase